MRSRRVTIDELRKAYAARPFRPFVLHLADGREIRVRHPEFLAMAPTGRIISVTEGEGFHVIDMFLVTDLEFRGRESSSRRRRKSA
jgi:hypothetical protein